MGAGSAKGINSSPEDEGDVEDDRFSVVSRHGSPEKTHKTKGNIERRSSIQDLSIDLSDDDDTDMALLDQKSSEKKEEKKKGLFGFSRRKDEEEDKTSAFVHEEEESKPKGDGKKEKGFKLFNWKKDGKKVEEKDETLDQEINDLHRTFDSLGIEAKSWEGQKELQKKSQSADDIRKLSPMRNRVKPRPLRTSHSRRATNTTGSFAGNGPKNIKYSWETETVDSNAPTDEDQWSYKAVVIDGFDIEKFKRANFEVR